MRSTDVDRHVARPGAAQSADGDDLHSTIVAWLSEQEREHRHVVLEADDGWTPWTRRCLRQADRVLVVGRAGDDPAPGEVEAASVDMGLATRRDLVLLQADDCSRPSHTARWLAHRDDRRRARLAGEERELADGRAAPRLLEHAHAAVGIVGDRTHAAVHDDVDVVAPVALPEERLASGERDPVELRFDVGDRRGVEGAEDPGKRFGELRVARGVQRSVLHRPDDGGCRAAAQVARSHFPSM